MSKTRQTPSGTVACQSSDETVGTQDWDDYFYEMAEVTAKRSKDPNSKVGAVIVSDDRVVLSTGYNGPARGVMDLATRIHADKDEKLRWMCHAEVNAVFNAARVGTILRDGTIYVTKFPCVGCAGAIVQSGIKRVFTKGDFWRNDPCGDDGTRSYTVLAEAGVQIHAPHLTGGISFNGNRSDVDNARIKRLAREFAEEAAAEVATKLTEILKESAGS